MIVASTKYDDNPTIVNRTFNTPSLKDTPIGVSTTRCSEGCTCACFMVGSQAHTSCPKRHMDLGLRQGVHDPVNRVSSFLFQSAMFPFERLRDIASNDTKYHWNISFIRMQLVGIEVLFPNGCYDVTQIEPPVPANQNIPARFTPNPLNEYQYRVRIWNLYKISCQLDPQATTDQAIYHTD